MRCFCFVPVPRAPACVIAFGLVVWGAAACAPNGGAHSLAGDWDAYLARARRPSRASRGGDGWVRALRGRRLDPRRLHQPAHWRTAARRGARRARSDSVILSDDSTDRSIAVWHGDTLTGVLLRDGKPAGQRIRLVRRSTPFVVEQSYALWPGAVSDSQYAVTEDTLVFMKTRDGARLAAYIARPVGRGPSASCCSERRTLASCIPRAVTGRLGDTSSSRSTCVAATSPTARISATTTPTCVTGTTPSSGRRSCPARMAESG